VIWELFLADALHDVRPRWDAIRAETVRPTQTAFQSATIEEGATNGVPDPVFGNGDVTAHWQGISSSGAVATLDRLSAAATAGSSGARLTGDGSGASQGIGLKAGKGIAAAVGQTWTVTAQVKASAPSDVGKTVQLVVSEYNAGGSFLSNHFGAVAFVLRATAQDATSTVTLSQAAVAKIVVKVVFVGTQSGSFDVGAMQAEQKDHATSLADGDMGAGYGWVGTAHASASTRAASVVSLPVGDRLPIAKGSACGWVKPGAIVSGQVLWAAGSGATTASLTVADANGNLALAWGSDALTLPRPISRGVWSFWYADWDGTAMRGGIDETALLDDQLATGSRTLPGGDFAGGDLLVLGSDGAAHFLNGAMLPMLTANRPLSEAERAALRRRTARWGWSVLDRALATGQRNR
jgi:hypothetical protein